MNLPFLISAFLLPSLRASSLENDSLSLSILTSMLHLTEDEVSTSSTVEPGSIDSVSPGSPYRLDASFYDMVSKIMLSRETLVRHSRYIIDRIEEHPLSVAKLERNLASMEEALRNAVDCNGVELAHGVDEELIALFHNDHGSKIELLRSLPPPIACFLIQRRVDKGKYKLYSLKKVGMRLTAVIELLMEVIQEIDSAFAGGNTQQAVKAFWVANFGPLIDSRGRWIEAVRRNYEYRDRLERIQAEFVRLREEGMGYTSGMPSKIPTHAERVFSDDLLRIMNIHFEEGRDILLGTPDSLIRRIVSQIGSHFHTLTVCSIFKEALAKLTQRVKLHSDEEQTLQFEALGIHPLLSYNKKNIPVGCVDIAINEMSKNL